MKNRNELLFFVDMNALVEVAVLDLLIAAKLDQEVRIGVQATVFQDLADRQRRLGRRLRLVVQKVRDGVNRVVRLLRLGRAHADLLIAPCGLPVAPSGRTGRLKVPPSGFCTLHD
jgi:hypothetical protein